MIAFTASDDSAARADWARMLEGFPAACIHADARWLDVVGRVYGARGVFAFERASSGEPRAGLVGYESRTLRGRKVLHSLRHGLIAHDPKPLAELTAAVAAKSCERGMTEAIVGGGTDPAPPCGRASTRLTVSLDLSAGPELLWNGFRDKVRNTIRKAERGGLTVSRDTAHLDAFHAIHARAMTERRGRVRGRSFFHTLFEVFGDDARLYSALDGGRVCGGMVVMAFGGYASYPFGAFDEQGRRLGANSLLLWRVAQDLCAEGMRELDLGPSAQGSGAYRFKVHLGGSPRTLYYVDLLQPVHDQAPQLASAPGEASTMRQAGRLDRAIEWLPFPVRVQARTWLGCKGRLL